MSNKGAYIELSPSGKGLHIFFIGQWQNVRNKGNQAIVIPDSDIKITCEIYSGKDIRYITITVRMLNNNQYFLPLANMVDISDELQGLKKLFFCDLTQVSSMDSAAIQKVSKLKLYEYPESKVSFFSVIDFLDNMIKSCSALYQKYINLCNFVNNGYDSPSEADWAFCSIVASLIPPDIFSYNIKYQVIEYLFKRDRKYRSKFDREDYISRTINSVLLESFF